MSKRIIKKNNTNVVNKKSKKDPNDLTFLEHANELRIRLLISVLVIFTCFIILFIFSKQILMFLTEPIKELGYQLHFYKVHEAFFSTLKASFFASLIISSPLWLWLLIGFIIPAFDKRHKRIFLVILFFCVLLLVSGFFFSYKILIPISLNYLLSFSKGELTSVISIEFYLNYFLALFFSTGIGFQLPLIMLFLSNIGFIGYKNLSKGRKYAIVIILVAAAALTPPDLISQVLLGVPIYLLFEIGLVLVYLSDRNKKNF